MINGVVTILLGILILIFSAAVINATRGHIYHGDRFVMGGRFSAALFTCITYVAIVLWLLFLAVLVVPTFCWIMFNSVCTAELASVWHGPGAKRPGPDNRVAPTIEELRQRERDGEDTYRSRLVHYYPDQSSGTVPGLPARHKIPVLDENGIPYIPGPYSNRFYREDFRYIFNLTHYGIYLKPWLYDKSLNYHEAIIRLDTFAEFCDEVSILGPLFTCSLGGAMFVLLGLTLFVGSLSGFYTRLKLTKELNDFKQSFALRSPKVHDHSAYF